MRETEVSETYGLKVTKNITAMTSGAQGDGMGYLREGALNHP